MATKKGRSSASGPRVRAAGILLALGLAAGIAISWKLWLTERDFPHMPCFAWFGPWPAPWDAVLLGGMGAALAGWIARPRWRWLLAVTLSLAVVIALQDQVRWQPWYYLYLLGLAAFLLPGAVDRPAGQDGLLGLLRFLLVCLYFWSGYHKLGPGFPRVHQVAFEEPLRERWGESAAKLLGHVSPVVPWLEMIIALCLLVPVLRKPGVVLAVGTHLWLLLHMGPLGTNDNEVVWPWNLCMALLVPLVFWGAPAFGWQTMLATPCRYATAALVVLTGIMPAFSPGAWDRYLSFHLYAGKDHRVMLVLDREAVVAIPPRYRAYLRPSKVDDTLLELRPKDWTLEEFKVPFPAEERLNLRFARQFAVLPFPDQSTVFFYFDYEFQLAQRGWDRLSPAEMLRLKKFPEPRRKYRNPES